MTTQNIFEQAEHLAGKIRQELGLGYAPIKDIFSILENRGIFVVQIPIPGENLSGAFYYDKKNKSAKILINNSRTPGHRVYTAAHEFCHSILDADRQYIIDYDKAEKLAYEKRADGFAAYFLMPKQGIEFYTREILKKNKKLDDFDIVKIKDEFSVSWSALIHRLHNLGYFFNKPFQEKIADIRNLNVLSRQLGIKPERCDGSGEIKLPTNFYRLAFEAYFNKRISLERLAKILRQSYEETKDWVAEIRRTNEELKK